MSATFENNYKLDRNFFLVYVLLIWLGIGVGFGRDIVRHFQALLPPYPLIVHFHAAAFVGWLLLLTVQILLIRALKLQTHRQLGVFGAVLALAMVLLGPATAVIVDGLKFGQPGSNPAFLSVQFTDILAFAGLVTAAIVLRKHAAAHKRLILLATLYISDAGWSRWLGSSIVAIFGTGYCSTLARLYLSSDLLVVGLGVYDYVTRRRLHPAYVGGVVWTVANQLTAVALLSSPAWGSIALHLIGH